MTTHTLHDYIAEQLARHVRERTVVVWFDPRSEFEPFLSELPLNNDGLETATINGINTTFTRYDGSMYALRHLVEPLVASETPEPLVIYLPGIEQSNDSPLMELELAGTRWIPQLRQLARNALQQRYSAGMIDDLLNRDNLRYEDLAAAAKTTDSGGAPPSVLNVILNGRTPETQIAQWLLDSSVDTEITDKEAITELHKLVEARLGLHLDDDDLDKCRSITTRFVLATEFRQDLQGPPPTQLDQIPETNADGARRASQVAVLMRDDQSGAYALAADRVQAELNLNSAQIDALELGSIDTFRFEEHALLVRCAELVRDGSYQQTLDLKQARIDSYWLRQSVERRAQWRAIELAAELGTQARTVQDDLRDPPNAPEEWIRRYADHWYALDSTQRRLEAWLPRLDEEPDERAVAAVRDQYETALEALSDGFTKSLINAGWSIDHVLAQTAIFDKVVRPESGRVAYFLVDAMRYEMGAELADRLMETSEVRIDPAAGVLPSITATGMAALMPGASSSYDVVESNGKLCARIDETDLFDLKTRKKHLQARVPSSVDIDLGALLELSQSRLTKKIGDNQLVVVRSQEIDAFGEGGFGYQARAVMDNVISDLARAVKKLARAGIPTAVIAADHGHLFMAEARDDSMKIDAPGGDTVDLHRRCWVGRGGSTPVSTARVSAQQLGNDSDLDLVVPTTCGVFKAGGDLSFHHGGATLQEMVIPVITVRSTLTNDAADQPADVTVTDLPDQVTNRMFSIKMTNASMLGNDRPVRPALLTDGRQVGEAGMAMGTVLNDDGSLSLGVGVEATIGFMLTDDKVESLHIVIFDPTTDAELYRSPAIPVHLGVA